jgi:hypothetical protein
MPDGRLVFYPTLRGLGYLVPDAEREQALRVFSRHLSVGGLVFGIVVMVVGTALMPVTFPLISWLVRSARLPMTAVIPLWSIAQTSGIFAALFAGLRLWRRGATRGLELVVEKRERPRTDQWVDDFVQDLPVAVRWIILAAIVLLFVESFRGVWDARDKLSMANIERISFMGWLDVTTSLFGLCFFGWLLFAAARRQRRLREP